MRTHTILAFTLLLAVRAASQHAPRLPAQANCKFSGGTTMTVSYSKARHSYLFRTDGSLITIKGVRVPSGDYAVSIAKDEYSNWKLRMRRPTPKTGDAALPPLAMSMAWKELAVDSFPVVFEQTGGSCKMFWRQNDYLVLSLEFTKENADIPVFKLMPRRF